MEQAIPREPVAQLLNQFGLPVSNETVQLAETLAEYAWASDTPGGKDAVAYLSGLKAISLLFQRFSGGQEEEHKIKLIFLLRVETIKGITDYVNSHQRISKADLEAEVQRRIGVFAQQVLLIQEGIITWQGGSAGGVASVPADYGSHPPPSFPSGGSGRPSHGRAAPQKQAKSAPAKKAPVTSRSTKPEKADSSTSLLGGLFGSRSSTSTDSGSKKQKQKEVAPASKPPSRTSVFGRSDPAPASKVSEPVATVVKAAKVEAAPPPAASPREPPPPVQRPAAKQLHPTVLPVDGFDVDADVEALRKAMKGMGCDDKAVLQVLAYRSNAQRQEICKRFKSTHGKDLPKELEGELRGNMEDVALALVKTAYDYDAYLLRKAMKGIGTSEDVLIELFASRSSKHLQEVGNCFQRMYGRDLEREVKSETSGDFGLLMIGRLTKMRSDSLDVDEGMAREDAQALYHAGEGKRGTNEKIFIDVFTTRSNAQLFATIGEYERISKRTLEEAVISETSGDLRSGLKAIVRCATDTQDYFARLLYKSMEGAGTNDDQLIRCVVSRCEVDMVEIKQAFQSRYGKSLKSFIEGDTSGNYRRFLLGLIAEN